MDHTWRRRTVRFSDFEERTSLRLPVGLPALVVLSLSSVQETAFVVVVKGMRSSHTSNLPLRLVCIWSRCGT